MKEGLGKISCRDKDMEGTQWKILCSDSLTLMHVSVQGNNTSC